METTSDNLVLAGTLVRKSVWIVGGDGLPVHTLFVEPKR